ncbi:Veg family protein [Periweissella fabaria]|uniref:Protein Veg n=1 Tax=Periweissella fabaria TaxID=546157 RepID=A0ABM8Z6Q2_9LACO|nr:Veg family protein [Periweissella fabaria]MCM0597687.1 Veg family protein [Periweissella fabaria]CAH0416874.1 Protein Veg [Periweissella fabaria]
MPSTLASIKQSLDAHRGETMTVTAQAGRKKVTERTGVLRETYPAVFVVDYDKTQSAVETVSYSYTDVLTQNIELAFNE